MYLLNFASNLFKIFRIMATSSKEPSSSVHLDSAHSSGISDQTIASSEISKRTRKKLRREFDFSLWNFRHVAFRIAYLGWNYHGLAIQESTDETIEAKLFDCFMKTRLIEDRTTCNYSRCGRTDTGVSALGQVIALNVRSNLLEGTGVISKGGSKVHERKGDKTTEIQYMHILNKVLPKDIRVLACAPVHPDFSARFNCLQRMYKYFFPLGNMNIEIMQEACRRLIGEHDFRNFCKMDIGGGVTNFVRRISNFTIKPLDGLESGPSPYQMYEMTITGQAFLWHQVRCMVGILFLIGNGLEKAELIDHMLDIKKCPGKPQYGMASELPLILYDCIFEDVDWEEVDQASYTQVVSHFQQLWTKQMIQTTMIRRMLDSLQLPLLLTQTETSSLPKDQVQPLIVKDHKLGQGYKPLLSRPTASTFEERFEHHKAKKRKVNESSDDNSS